MSTINNESAIDPFLQIQQKPMVQEILNTLLEGEQDLDLKTHVLQPKDTTSLYLVGLMCKSLEYHKSAKLIKTFITKYLRYMISYKRMSRKEIIQALSTINNRSVDDDDMDGMKKFITNLSK